MVFSSLFFLYAFLPLSLVAYSLCKTLKAKNICLLAFSIVFYTWGEPKYVLLLALMSLVDWYIALKIQNFSKYSIISKKTWLILACIVNLGLIGLFKYSKMICSVFGDIPEFIANISLPLGISFYTFQLLSYVVDVYRGEVEAREKYWHVLLYASLFHQCIAGPIVRYSTVSEELFVERDCRDISTGVCRFSKGLAKKAILANSCGVLADKYLLTDSTIAEAASYASNQAFLASIPSLGLWIGIISFSLQIYFDFSAYSDMAIGMGQMVGLHYLENFNFPYISKSVTEFWRRWHISLGSFFRDYVYIPLGGNRCSPIRRIFNLLVVWALTGLWHGANWNFVIWGLYFFVFLMIEKTFLLDFFSKIPRLLSTVLSHIYTLFVAIIGWGIFKYTDIRLFFTAFKGLFCMNGNALSDFASITVFKSNLFFFIFCFICCTPVFKLLEDKCLEFAETHHGFSTVFQIVKYCVIPVALLLISTASLVGDSYNPFLYFRF